jgi:flavin-dependent dehydrogenase
MGQIMTHNETIYKIYSYIVYIMKYDIIIIGSGISGLYAAYNIKKTSPDTSFLILEKYKKQWIGGRTSNELFYGTDIVTGAGIGRTKKDKLLRKLLIKIQRH